MCVTVNFLKFVFNLGIMIFTWRPMHIGLQREKTLDALFFGQFQLIYQVFLVQCPEKVTLHDFFSRQMVKPGTK